ncbi:MAG: polysaccharide deacetylase family protein [Clostridia bacterium]|nr:polysaccharide deacetylase family protein [Clostridia bacterium]
MCILVLSGCVSDTQNNTALTDESGLDAAATTEKYDTFTGKAPLKPINFDVADPQNTKGLSTKKIAHSFGVASNGESHEISKQSQKYFEENNVNAITYNTSGEKVLYLTFDCGYENGNTEIILDVLKEKNVKAAFFCTLINIKSSPELMARIINEGHILGNHSSNHPCFDEISREEMAQEIEECDNYLREKFGYTSPYFRFPKGEYSECALDLVNSIGFKCVFWSLAYNDWNTDSQKGADYAFETVTSRLHPGAIILLHSVSSDNAEAMGRIIDYAREQGYSFKTLNDL